MSKKLNAQEKLIANIKQYPDNLQAAIRLTSRQTKLTVNQLNYMYYGNQKKDGLRKHKAMFITFTDNGMTINRKRSMAVKETPRTLKLTNDRPLDISKFSDEDKVALVDMLIK